MRRHLLLLVLLIIFTLSNSYAQTATRVSGSVKDSTARPIALVTVRIYKSSNPGEPVQMTMSKEDGSFQFLLKDAGKLLFSFTHTGYAEIKKEFVIKRGEELKLDPIILSRYGGALKEVVVTAQKPMVEQADDRVIFNVSDDPTAKTETAIDILRKTPFVTVDGEDNIKVNGKSNFKVLLNNRETSMFARNVKEALRGFPGALIAKIEVITNPSAKYDGEGIGGLINIITKKKIIGYNGTLSTFSRTSDKLNSFSINANAKLARFGGSLFYNMGVADPAMQQDVNTTVPNSSAAFTKRILAGNTLNSSGWSFGNAEISYEMDTINTFSLYANVDGWWSQLQSDHTITTEFNNASPMSSDYNVNNKTDNPGYNVGLDYIRKSRKNKDGEFSLKTFAEFGKTDADISSSQDNPGTDRFLINHSHAVNNQYTIELDHVLPLKRAARLETGAKAILRRASSDFQSLVKYNPLDKYELNPLNTDNFKYSQDVWSGYSTYSFKIKKYGFRTGLRVEYTRVYGNFFSSNTSINSDYVTVMPDLQVTKSVSTNTKLTLGYNKRLSRPYIWDLNPFVFNSDSLNISFGNPDLGPQTIHNLSLQLRYNKGVTFAAVNLDASYSNNKILNYASFDPQTGITKTTSLNIGKEFQSSLGMNLNTKINRKWNLNINGALRYSTITNNANPSESNSGLGCNFNLSTRYALTTKFTVSSYLGLWKDPITIQTTYPFSTWYNVALNYKVFSDKLNISLRTVNFFETDHNYVTVTKNYYSSVTSATRQVRRGAVLALTYNFGKLTESVSKKQGVNNDDLLRKPKAPASN